MRMTTLPAWFDRATARTVGIAAATALGLGVGAGGALSLPPYMAEHLDHPAPDLAGAQDPGEVEWRTVIARLGGLEATRVIAAYVEPLPTDRSAIDGELREVYARLDALDAQLDASQAAWNRDRADWIADFEARRRQAEIGDDGYDSRGRLQPAAYEDDPLPPPVPVPEGW